MTYNLNRRQNLTLAVGLSLLMLGAFAASAQAQGNLVIGGKPMVENAENYQQFIKFLTVAPANQAQDPFKSSDVAAIRALEDPMRRQIVDAMNRNRLERFAFASVTAAQENINMRLWAIDLLLRMEKAVSHGGVDFNYPDAKNPVQADARFWQKVDASMSFRSKPGTRAADAIDAMVKGKFRGECLGAIEIAVLHAARKAMGTERFNKLHSSGLIVGPKGKSAFKHTRVVNRITVNDMVPGDWVYMKNKDDYSKGLRPGVKVGFWSGENALYMGKYDKAASGARVFRSNAPARFSGMGVYHVTQKEFQAKLKEAYLALMQPPYTTRRHTISDADIRFTHLSRLVVSL